MRAVLTEEEVRARLRAAYALTPSLRRLAQTVGVPHNTLSGFLRGRRTRVDKYRLLYSYAERFGAVGATSLTPAEVSLLRQAHRLLEKTVVRASAKIGGAKRGSRK